MLDELGAVDIGHENRRHKWLINLLHEVDRRVRFGLRSRCDQAASDRATAQPSREKFRITDHVEVCAMAVIPFD